MQSITIASWNWGYFILHDKLSSSIIMITYELSPISFTVPLTFSSNHHSFSLSTNTLAVILEPVSFPFPVNTVWYAFSSNHFLVFLTWWRKYHLLYCLLQFFLYSCNLWQSTTPERFPPDYFEHQHHSLPSRVNNLWIACGFWVISTLFLVYLF